MRQFLFSLLLLLVCVSRLAAQTVTGQRLTIGPGQLLVDSSGDVDAAGFVEVPGWVSEVTGWHITPGGAGDFRYLFTDQLHAKEFIADLEQALAGGQIISKSVTTLAANFACPVAGAGATLTVDDLPGASAAQVFQANDWVVLRNFTRAAGSLTIADCVGVVTSPTTPGGTQTWTFTRGSGGSAGTMVATTVVNAKSLALDYGVSGNGYYEVNAIDGSNAVNSPYAQIVTWATAPVSGNETVKARYGNLYGITGVSGEYGLFAGTGTTSADQILTASNDRVLLTNINLNIYTSGTRTVGLCGVVDANCLTGSIPSMALGATAPSAYGTGTGIWMGNDSGTYKFRVGVPSGAGLFWDGATLTVAGNGPGNSGNQVSNSDCAASTTGWTAGTNSGLTMTLAQGFAPWLLNGYASCYFEAVGTPAGATVGNASTGTVFPVLGGNYYEASAYLGVQRTGPSQVYINWFDTTPAFISQNLGNNCTTATPGGATLAGYCRSGVIAQAPSNAVTAQVVVNTTYTGGQLDPYIFWVHTYFGEATATQTQLSAWVPPGQTSITGGLIQAGSIVTGNLAASSVTASKLNVATLDAITGNMGTLTSGSITGGSINGATVTIPPGNSGAGLLTIGSGTIYYFGGQLNVTGAIYFSNSPTIGGLSSAGNMTVCANSSGTLYLVASGAAC